MQDIRFVIITGLSGAGKSQAVHALEDSGFFCVDNLPPTLIPKFAELCAQSEGKISRIALVSDIRGGDFFNNLFEALEHLEEIGLDYEILFLEASDQTLVRRFKETRRRHPLSPEGRLIEGITAERKKLEALRLKANIIIDTTNLTPAQLKEKISRIYAGNKENAKLMITVVSFGFKYGIPLDADLVFDVRFLPNPFYVENLKSYSGNEQVVHDYVWKWPVTQKFLQLLVNMLDFLIPHYIKEGKTQLVIALGCTGGRHRSVVIANRLYETLIEKKHRVVVEHRDVEKEHPGVEAR